MCKSKNYDISHTDNIALIIKHFYNEYKEYKHDEGTKHLISNLYNDANDNDSNTGTSKQSIDRTLLDSIWEEIRKIDLGNYSHTNKAMDSLTVLSIVNDLKAVTEIVDKELNTAIRTVYMSHFIHSLEHYARSLSDLRLTARFLPFFPAAALPKYSRSPATLRFCRLASGKNHQKSPRSLKVRQTPRRKLCSNFIVNLKAVETYRTLYKKFPSFKNSHHDNEVCVGKYKKEGRFEILYNPTAEPHHIRAGIGHELGHLMCIICEGIDSPASHDEIFCSFLSIWFLAHRSNFYESTCRDFIMDFETIVKNVYFFHTNHKNKYKNHTKIKQTRKSTT